MIEAGTLRLPEMQREYVWTAAKVRDLFDSLYRGYPSGVILAWEPSEVEDAGVKTRSFAIEAGVSMRRSLLLLDGQQRLTSLSAVLRGEPVQVKWRKRPIELLFNLDHPDELMSVMETDTDDPVDESELSLADKLRRRAFVVGTKQLAAQQQWVRVSDIFREEAIDILEAKGFDIGSMDRDLRRKYTSRLGAVKAIEDYSYRVEILEKDKSYEEVTEIFVRVNSLGARLRSSDLALAQITAVWRGSLEIFTEYEQRALERGFGLDLGNILRTLVAIVTEQPRFSRLGSQSQGALEAGWDRTKKALDFAHNFLVNDLGIESPAVLTSPLLVVATAYWGDKRGYQIDNAEKEAFRHWALIANAKGRYSRGSSESMLDQDLSEIRSGSGVSGLLQRLTAQVGRTEFTVEELEGRTPQSGAYKTFLLALRQAGAVDWDTKLLVSAKHQGEADAVEYHHIFPQAYLKEVRPDLSSSAMNDIANMAIVGGSTNRRISKTAPSVYRDWFETPVLRGHLVDFSDGLDRPDRYEEFTKRRRVAMAEVLNRFLGVVPGP
jgi:hypothetical protein